MYYYFYSLLFYEYRLQPREDDGGAPLGNGGSAPAEPGGARVFEAYTGPDPSSQNLDDLTPEERKQLWKEEREERVQHLS